MMNIKTWQLLTLFLYILISQPLILIAECCLTLKEALEIALDQNPANRAADFGIEAAHESVGVAKAPYYPNVEAYFSYSRWQQHIFLPSFPKIPGFNFAIPSIVGPTNDWALGVRSNYTIYDWGRRRAQLQTARAQRGVALYEAERISQDIALNVATAFYSLLASMEIEIVAKKQYERAENHLWIVRQRREAGDAPLIDVYKTEVEVANAKQTIIQAQTQVQIGRGNLNIVMGLHPNTCIEICREIGPIRIPQDNILCGAYETAAANRPELLISWQRILALRSLVNEAKSDYGPVFSARGHYGWEDEQFFPRDKSWLIGVNADWTLFQGFGRVHNLRKARAQMHQEEQEYEKIGLQVQQDVWSAFVRLKEAYERLEIIRVQIRSAQESLRLAEQRYQAGAGTLTDMLDAQTALTASEADYVQAQWNYFTALATFKWSQGVCI